MDGLRWAGSGARPRRAAGDGEVARGHAPSPGMAAGPVRRGAIHPGSEKQRRDGGSDLRRRQPRRVMEHRAGDDREGDPDEMDFRSARDGRRLGGGNLGLDARQGVAVGVAETGVVVGAIGARGAVVRALVIAGVGMEDAMDPALMLGGMHPDPAQDEEQEGREDMAHRGSHRWP